MQSPEFETPREAEDAFYDAFAKTDLAAMAHVWDTGDDVECIHPMGARLVGPAVLDSWREMFERAGPIAFHLTDRREFRQSGLAVHVLVENIHFRDDSAKPLRFLTTNVYREGETGWRIVLHHSSPAPIDSAREQPPGHSVH